MHLLAPFTTLWLKPGYILRAYQFIQGGNGNGVVYAMPEGAPFPDPDDCRRDAQRFLRPPVPPDALPDVMAAIDGDGSPWSYLSASVLARELAEFGAMWHGCNWSVQRILEEIPADSGLTWIEAQPENLRPSVEMSADGVTVTFCAYSVVYAERVTRHVDRYMPGSYTFTSETTVLATGTRLVVF
jgi:hypothetical protein